MAIWTPTAISDRSTVNWSLETGSGSLFLAVDEGIASADNTGVKATTSTSFHQTIVFGLSSPPADLGTITNVSIQVRHKQSGRSDDTLDGIYAQIGTDDGDAFGTLTIDSGGGFLQITTSNIFATSYTNSDIVSFPTVTQGSWANPRVQITSPQRTQVKGADTIIFFIDTFNITITYTPAATFTPIDPMGASGFFGI